MRNFYNVPCPCSKITYESTNPLAPDGIDTHCVEASTRRVFDFGAFLDEVLSQDGDYFLYTMETEFMDGSDDGVSEVDLSLRFRYGFISQEIKDARGLGKVIAINSKDRLKSRGLKYK